MPVSFDALWRVPTLEGNRAINGWGDSALLRVPRSNRKAWVEAEPSRPGSQRSTRARARSSGISGRVTICSLGS